MFYNFMSTLVKFTLGAVLIGALLNEFNISADQVLTDVGLTPQHIMAVMREGVEWALPHFILGAIVLVPIWIVIFLLKPPRLGK
ncbi:MAG: DUF6460 domain-containing protein [Parvibaculum sp.]|uniref:DUF6460 domain-containing protein n=1 Tax=Parvibaculum sp. TaxID=2024848 RepID=UPI002C988087|nr:DUF6460 domain-containing protein [Parvibaculum sp.]HMM13371.1 DUF6460 domain-containing protein [Parvibaculum sp.]